MAKKHVEIEVIDKTLEEVTTGGGVIQIQPNNVPNAQFGWPLDTSNVGESGCSSTQDYVDYNFSAGGGTPVNTNLKPCSYNVTGSGLNTQGNCYFFRDTEEPYLASSQLVFPSTVGGGAAADLVLNGDFGLNVNNPVAGFANNVWESGAGGNGANPWTNAMDSGNIETTPSALNISENRYWWGASTYCDSLPYPGILTIEKPEINDSAAFLKLQNNQNSYYGAACALSEYGYTGVYQVIQGLTAGEVYDLEVKFKNIPSGANDWGFGLGNPDLDGGRVCNGDVYVNLGGDTAPMYQGANSAGTPTTGTGYYATSVHPYYPINPTQTTPMTTEFTSVGGNEVLTIRYKSYDVTGISSVLGAPIEIDYIKITPKPTGPYNASTVYGVATAYDYNAGAVPTSATLKFDFIEGDYASIVIEVCSGWINPPSGLNMATDPLVITNNPNFPGMTSFNVGMNSITIPINGSSSTAPYAANDRLFTFSVLNPYGPDAFGKHPTFGSIDIEYTYTTLPTSHYQPNPAVSVIGLLEVSDSEDFPLNISYTVSDGKNLDARFGDYSQTFDLPATANNNRILNHIWKANVDQSSKKLFGVKDCRVLVNGVPFFDGMMQVKASEHKGSPESYSCTLYGGNFSWMSTLKDKNLCEVFDDTDTFTFDYFNIENTFLQTQDTTNIQYPLISRKDFNFALTNPASLPNYVNLRFADQYPDWQPAFYVKNIIEKIFANIGYTIESNFMDTNHFKRLLCDFPFLKNDSQNAAENYSTHVTRNHLDNQLLEENVLIGGLQTSGVASDGWHTIKLNQTVSDPSGQYDATTGEWTCALDGVYDVNVINGACFIQLNGKGSNVSPDGYTFECKATSPNARYWNVNTLSGDLFQQDGWGVAYRVRVTHLGGSVSYLQNGNPIPEDGWYVPTGFNLLPLYPYPSGNLSCFSNADDLNGNMHPSDSITLVQGDKMELQVKALGLHASGIYGNEEPYVDFYAGYNNDWTNSIPPELSIVYASDEPFIGDNLKANEILPCDITQINYIKSISHLFNLYFTTDVQAKKVYIEPFNEFFKPTSEGVKWDNKVDYTEPINDDYDIGLKRELIIKYKTDSADKYAEALNNKKNIWGEENRLYNYKETLGEDYESGEVVLENPIFASTTQVWDNDAHSNPPMDKSPVLIPNIWNEDAPWSIVGADSMWRPAEIIESFVPRVYYYAWESPCIGTTLPSGLIANLGGTRTYWSTHWPGGADTQNQEVYPRATFVDWEEKSHAITQRPSLSFNDELFIAPGQMSGNTVPGLYTTYYKNMIEQLKKAPRIRTISVNLKLADILNLDMRKLVYLDETWWRINRIVEFSPAQNKSTRVELIQWLDVGFWPIYINTDKINYT